MKKGITSSVLSKLRATDSRKERSDRKAASLSSLCNNATIVLIDAYGERLPDHEHRGIVNEAIDGKANFLVRLPLWEEMGNILR